MRMNLEATLQLRYFLGRDLTQTGFFVSIVELRAYKKIHRRTRAKENS